MCHARIHEFFPRPEPRTATFVAVVAVIAAKTPFQSLGRKSPSGHVEPLGYLCSSGPTVSPRPNQALSVRVPWLV
jgi:hypothetical protein